jgi:hypothetical protein
MGKVISPVERSGDIQGKCFSSFQPAVCKFLLFAIYWLISEHPEHISMRFSLDSTLLP